MNLIRQPNEFSCLPTSYAMVTGKTPEYYFKEIGHDGSAECFPGAVPPFDRRCFSSPECAEVAYHLGYYSYEIPNGYSHGKLIINPDINKMYKYMAKHKGVILGKFNYSVTAHAMAWDGHEVYDPTGFVTLKEAYEIDSFIIIGEL